MDKKSISKMALLLFFIFASLGVGLVGWWDWKVGYPLIAHDFKVTDGHRIAVSPQTYLGASTAFRINMAVSDVRPEVRECCSDEDPVLFRAYISLGSEESDVTAIFVLVDDVNEMIEHHVSKAHQSSGGVRIPCIFSEDTKIVCESPRNRRVLALHFFERTRLELDIYNVHPLLKRADGRIDIQPSGYHSELPSLFDVLWLPIIVIAFVLGCLITGIRLLLCASESD